MTWSDDLKISISLKLDNFQIYFSAADVPRGVVYPPQWSQFGYRDSAGGFIPPEWAQSSKLLPWVSDWLAKCVIGTLLAIGDKPYLVYVYREDGELYFYLGGAPLSVSKESRIQALPSSFQDFYTTLHDGFVFSIDYSMGPSRFVDFIEIDELCDEPGIEYPGVVAVFSSGAGDYVCLNENPANANALIWWHEDPGNPSDDVNLWGTIDGWMCVFLENSDSNEE